MATSSITHNFVFDAESTQRFVDQFEEAERYAKEHPVRRIGKMLNREEISALFAKILANEK